MRAAPSSEAPRDRVTIDLRGIRPQIEAEAARRQLSTAAFVRHAVKAMINEASAEVDTGPPPDALGSHTVKVTLRLGAAHAGLLSTRARRADVSQGRYVVRLLDGAPVQAQAPDHTRAVAALMASTDRLAALSADLNAFMRLVSRVPTSELEPYRASLRSLTDDVRVHLASAAALMAAFQATGGRR